MAGEKKAFDVMVKLLLIGDSSVGKSALVLRFTEDAFTDIFISTIGIDFKIRTVTLDGKKVKIQIWDTAGQERFKTIANSYYRRANGVVMVYDITNETSFNAMRGWIKNVEQHAEEGVVKVLVGNKCDLEEKRVVDKERGRKLAEENKISFYETSAKSGNNVEAAFLDLTRKVLEAQSGDPKPEETNKDNGKVDLTPVKTTPTDQGKCKC